MMKKIFYPFFILLMSCQSGQMSEDAHQLVVDSLNSDIKDKNRIINSLEYDVEFQDSLNNEYALYIQKIKDNLSTIQQNELILNKAKSAEFILADSLDVIKAIEEMIQKINENDELILVLNQRLQSSDKKNDFYAQTINELNTKIAVTNREVYFLKEEISQLSSSYAKLFNRYSEQVAKIDSLNLEMNKVGYVVGTKSELLENNVVTKEGGFIGIGKIKKLSDDLNLNYFTYNSKTDLNYILIGCRNIKLITSHPSSSFQLIKSQENVIDSLIILQKEEFWQNSKFLVIEVK